MSRSLDAKTSEGTKDEAPVLESRTATTVSKRRRRRLWLFRIVTLLVIAAVQEPLLRFLFPLPEVSGFNRIHYQQMSQSHPQIGKAMERGLVYDRLLLESRPDGFSEVHNLNLYGFRGPDFAIKPSPNKRRILVIGDSLTEGEGVDDSRTVTAEWSRILASEGTSAEVVNLGVIAASLPHLWILTRDAVSLLGPTDVVLMLYANDMPAPEHADKFKAPGPRFESTADLLRQPRLAVLINRAIFEKPIHRRWPHLPLRFFVPVPDSTNPWSDGKARPEGLSPRLYDDMVAGSLNPWLNFQAKDMPKNLAHDFEKDGSPEPFLDHMARLCEQHQARLIVAYTPFCGVVNKQYAPALVEMGMDRETAEALSTDPKYRSQNRILAEVCKELRLPLADATGDLEQEEAAGKTQYWRYDTHPNANGYATIARRIHAVWRDATGQGSTNKN